MLSFVGGEAVGWVGGDGTICYDGQGFWIFYHESLHLKFKNTMDSEKIYNIQAIPLIIRAKDY